MNVLPVYFPSLSIGPPKPPLAWRVAGLTGWLILILFYLIFTICQKAQTSLSPLFFLSESHGYSRYVFFEVTPNVVWHNRTVSKVIWARRQDTSIFDRVSLPQCSEDIGFVWSLLAVLCQGHGLVTTLVCSSSWPQVWWLHWYVQLPGSKMSGASLELKTVGCGWIFTLCQWKAPRLPQAFGFAFLPWEHFFLWKMLTENFITWEMDRIAWAFPAACS